MAANGSATVLQGALEVVRSGGIHAGWTLGEILRHGHTTGAADGISYLILLADGRLTATPEERQAAAVIAGHLDEVPQLTDDELRVELHGLLGKDGTW